MQHPIDLNIYKDISEVFVSYVPLGHPNSNIENYSCTLS